MATAAKTPTATVVTTATSESKAAKARHIFAEMHGSPRKDVVARFVSEANLTEKGAATYFQNFRREAGMVVARVETATAPTASGRNNASSRS